MAAVQNLRTAVITSSPATTGEIENVAAAAADVSNRGKVGGRLNARRARGSGRGRGGGNAGVAAGAGGVGQGAGAGKNSSKASKAVAEMLDGASDCVDMDEIFKSLAAVLAAAQEESRQVWYGRGVNGLEC